MNKRSEKSLRKPAVHVIALAALALILVLFFITKPAGEGYEPALRATVWSLLPPIVAITLAFITKEVYSSLFMGVLVGAFLYAGGNPEFAVRTMLFHPDGGLIAGITEESHAEILVFVILLGTLVVLMNRSGGAAAFGRFASKRIKTRVGAQLATVVMGLLIFVDDGFNCMTVGSVMRPITDSHGVSRAKLSYLIDSTAAPVCIIAPISCWAAAVSYSIPESMDVNGCQLFLHTIPYNLYAFVTLAMVILLAVLRFDFGKMKEFEFRAAAGEAEVKSEAAYTENEKTPPAGGRVSDLAIPVIVLIVSSVILMAYTGGAFSGTPFLRSFEQADSAKALVTGSLITCLVTLWLYLSRGVMNFKDFMACFAAGFRSMCAPMIILILSWNLSGMTGLLGAADYVHGTVEAAASALQIFIPFIIFLFSVFLAFSTGTSWGTFTILIPIVCAIFPADAEMLALSISACLAGAVCGDHCSPISDTTIMSSAGAQCPHMDHVATQLPYALTAAALSAVGYLAAGLICYFTENALAMFSLPLSIGLAAAVLLVLKKKKDAEKLSA